MFNNQKVKDLQEQINVLEKQIEGLKRLVGPGNISMVEYDYIVPRITYAVNITESLESLDKKVEKLTAIVNEVVDYVYREKN